MKRSSLIFGFLLFAGTLASQNRNYKVLFIGNSYTHYNKMPELFGKISSSAGYVVEVSASTPDGYTLAKHAKNTATLELIKKGGWDFVVLQEQGQLPSEPISQVNKLFYPNGLLLDSLVRLHNAESQTVFYATWGRRDGDKTRCDAWPPVCTYEGMDGLTLQRYKTIADSCNAILSPVSVVWRYLIKRHPGIELYDEDGKHPSPIGSYIAACCLFSVLFKENPESIKFNYILSDREAGIIKQAVKKTVFESLQYGTKRRPE